MPFYSTEQLRLSFPSSTFGDGAVIDADEVFLGQGVKMEPGSLLAGGSVSLGAGCKVGARADLRAGSFVAGDNSEFGADTKILVADEFAVGAATRISHRCDLTCRSLTAGDLLYCGHEVSVGYGGTLTSTAKLTFGTGVAVGPRNILNCSMPIHLDDQVGTSSYVTIWTHGYHLGHTLREGYVPNYEPVIVHRNVWLAFHTTVLPGVTIGENTIVAAGATVSKSLPANVLCGGVPARVISPLSPRPPDAAIFDEMVGDILEAWLDELAWKGLCVERSAPPTVRGPDGEKRLVRLLAGQDDPQHALDGRIFVSVDDRPWLRAALPASSTLFELRSGARSGRIDPIVEDLRDYLRRRTLICGHDLPFTTLPASGFVNLANRGRETRT